MEFPKDLKYTKDHEWVRVSGDVATVGVTAFAVDQLGDITLVDPPEVGGEVTAGEACGTIESVKSVSDLFAPLSGEITRVNDRIEDAPELVNDDPYGDGWLFELRPRDPGELEALLDADAYAALVAEEG